MALVTHFEELRVYTRAFDAAMEIFRLSKTWPAEERYSLTDQIRRSSRSGCGQLAEGWKKRRYPNSFIHKLTDSDGEIAETENWLKFALACEYISPASYKDLREQYRIVSAGLADMISNADSWCGPADHIREEHAIYRVNVDEDSNA